MTEHDVRHAACARPCLVSGPRVGHDGSMKRALFIATAIALGSGGCVRVTRDELGDPTMRTCVAVTTYPIHVQWFEAPAPGR